ncbi:hypothetical protein PQX77_020146 [Marasmius sp. AFHP31]|nr:hypothetical protein PQX77_020146 [Marasmius sp. AFHP31]
MLSNLRFNFASQEVKTLVRPSSVDKPIIKELASLGVEIVTRDIVSDAQETLEAHLKDVDMVLIATAPVPEGQQVNILCLAKVTGVNRVVPSDFGAYGLSGSMQYQDMKLRTQGFIRDNNIPYTFIQVEIWPDAVFPLLHPIDSTPKAICPKVLDAKASDTETTVAEVG